MCLYPSCSQFGTVTQLCNISPGFHEVKPGHYIGDVGGWASNIRFFLTTTRVSLINRHQTLQVGM